jgi:hypothetical protein
MKLGDLTEEQQEDFRLVHGVKVSTRTGPTPAERPVRHDPTIYRAGADFVTGRPGAGWSCACGKASGTRTYRTVAQASFGWAQHVRRQEYFRKVG